MQTTPIYAKLPLCATIKSKYCELIPSKQVMHDDECAAIVANAAAATVVHFRFSLDIFFLFYLLCAPSNESEVRRIQRIEEIE